MSSPKWTKTEAYGIDNFQAFWDFEFNFDERNQKRQNRQSFETAWNQQQLRINTLEKDQVIFEKKIIDLEDELNKALKALKESQLELDVFGGELLMNNFKKSLSIFRKMRNRLALDKYFREKAKEK